MLVLGASVDTLHSCLGAGAKLELHHNHCSLALPVQYTNNLYMCYLKPSKQEESTALLQPV